MKKENSGGCLAVARDHTAENWPDLPPKWMKVRLSSTEFLHHAYDMVGQTFPKGVGKRLGKTGRTRCRFSEAGKSAGQAPPAGRRTP